MMSSGSLRDIVVNQSRQSQQENESQQRERTILILGSKSVGKTTLIQRFLNRSETAKPTLALDYTFGRNTGKSLVKDICHIWELGGGILFTAVLKGVADKMLTQHPGCSPPSLVIMLDLSSLETLWSTMETLLGTAKSTHVNAGVIKSATSSDRIPKDHPDRSSLEPFPIPLVIVGGKYDVFQDYEPEKKRIVCRCLRFVAHTLCATLAFYSANDATLVKRMRETFSHLGFASPPVKSICQDYNKALFIPCGSDTLESIEGVNATTKGTIDKYKHLFTSHFTQATSANAPLFEEDPAQDPNFREPVIDALRRQKNEELERYCQEMKRREQNTIDTKLQAIVI